MSDNKCPRCGGMFEFETQGAFLDKVSVCQHCGHTVDVLDEVTIKREGETIHRRDLGGEQVMTELGDVGDILAQAGIEIEDWGGAKGKATTTSSGKVFRKTQVLRGDEARDAMADMGIDYDALTAEPSTNRLKLYRFLWVLIIGGLVVYGLIFAGIDLVNFVRQLL
jgi:hypothetical protein